MTLIDVEKAQLHSGFILNGVNLGGSTGLLDPKMKPGLSLKYDLDTDRLFIFYKGGVAMCKTDVKNIHASYEAFGLPEVGVVAEKLVTPVVKVKTKGAGAQVANISATAQVSTPSGIIPGR